MGVQFCIWLWRMYRWKQKQERLQGLNPNSPHPELYDLAPKPNAPEHIQPAR